MFSHFCDNLTDGQRIRRAERRVEDCEHDLRLAKEALERARAAAGNTAAANAYRDQQGQYGFLG